MSRARKAIDRVSRMENCGREIEHVLALLKLKPFDINFKLQLEKKLRSLSAVWPNG